MKKIHIIRLLAFALLIAYTISCSMGSEIAETSIEQDIKPLELTSIDTLIIPKEDTITIAAVGDIMMGTDYPNTRTLPPKDGATLFKDVQQYRTAQFLGRSSKAENKGWRLAKGGGRKQSYEDQSISFHGLEWKDRARDGTVRFSCERSFVGNWLRDKKNA